MNIAKNKHNIDEIIKEGIYIRNYREHSSEYSLNPAIARALNIIVGIDDKDRILDPFCGTGTILIERQLLNPCLCIGVDISAKMLDYAKQNSKNAEVPVDFVHGDILTKKFSANYFTKIISNLPYGIHSGSRAKNLELYKFLADTSIHWLKAGGKAVFITNAKSLLRNTFAYNSNWSQLEEYSIKVRGLTLGVFVFEKLK